MSGRKRKRVRQSPDISLHSKVSDIRLSSSSCTRDELDKYAHSLRNSERHLQESLLHPLVQKSTFRSTLNHLRSKNIQQFSKMEIEMNPTILSALPLSKNLSFHTKGPPGWRPGLSLPQGYRPPAPQEMELRRGTLYQSKDTLMQSCFTPEGLKELSEKKANVKNNIVRTRSVPKKLSNIHKACIRKMEKPNLDLFETLMNQAIDEGEEEEEIDITYIKKEKEREKEREKEKEKEKEKEREREKEKQKEKEKKSVMVKKKEKKREFQLPQMPKGWKPGDAIPLQAMAALMQTMDPLKIKMMMQNKK